MNDVEMVKSPMATEGRKLPSIHPGRILLENMRGDEISTSGLAQAIRVPANRTELIVK